MRLYILGAGASKPDGIPITSELFDRAFWHFGGNFEGVGSDKLFGSWDKEMVIERFKPVFKLFDDFYNKDNKNLVEKLETYYKKGYQPLGLDVSTNMIEDFFTRLDSMERGRNNYGFKLSHNKISKLSRYARLFFFHTLCYESINRDLPKHYMAFVDKVLQKEGKHCIISFNYDLLLEDALIKHLQPLNGKWVFPDNLKWTYCLNFASFDYPTPYKFPSDGEASIYYFKLHGSFNFGYCPEDKGVTVYCLHADHILYKRFYEGEFHCHHRSHVSKPLLIPPLRKKEIEIPELRLLWDKAYDLILKGTELHIIGYSLPEVDEEASNLLKAIPIDRLEKIIIANPNSEHVNRFLEIFKISSKKIKIYQGFEQYLAEEHGAALEKEERI